MSEAPTDGTDIIVLGPKGWRRAHYVCCQWMRDDGEDIQDAWRLDVSSDYIELDEARGWKPAADR